MSDATQRLRATVEHLERIERLPGSPGEREAAEWIAARLRDLGLQPHLEEERATGSFTLPLGLLSAGAAAAGALAPAGVAGRLLVAGAGLAAAAGVVDDTSGGPQLTRRLLPRRTTVNVWAEAGDPLAAETLVISSHHDAARGGLIFHPGPTTLVARRFPRWYERQETSPQFMRLVAGAPALMALAALMGRAGLRRAAALGCGLSAAAFADIAAHRVVPGANDNLSSVAALLEVAAELVASSPQGLRVILVSTGAEESSMEGMRGFLDRHGPSLPSERTAFLVLESIGGPIPLVLEGEGMIRMQDYDAGLRNRLAAAGEAAGVPLRRALRTGFATDGLIPMLAGYRTACLAACDELKTVPNYHSRQDTSDKLDYDTVLACTRVVLRLVRDLASVSLRT